MKKTQYSLTWKTVSLILQMVTLMVIIITIALGTNLMGRGLLGLGDLGNRSFFQSTAYRSTVETTVNDLVRFLMIYDSDKQDQEEVLELKKAEVEFLRRESNFYFWYTDGSEVVTNIEETVSSKNVIEYAKKKGSYVMYDASQDVWSDNIYGLDVSQMAEPVWLFEKAGSEGLLVIAVDTKLPVDDTFSQAKDTFEAYVPWFGKMMGLGLLCFLVFILCIIYVTLSAGRVESDEKVHMLVIDKIPPEILFLGFGAYMGLLVKYAVHQSSVAWSAAGTMIMAGTVLFITDIVLLSIYLSFVRRIKTDQFFKCSIIYKMFELVNSALAEKGITAKSVLLYIAFAILDLILAYRAMAAHSIWAGILLFISLLYGASAVIEQACQQKKIIDGIQKISDGDLEYKLPEMEFRGEKKKMAVMINNIGAGLSHAVESNVKNERTKSELITNMSHDIKTPLTSIINYVDLMKREQTADEKMASYIDILDRKSQRLRQLTEDLVEVSKITSGNVVLDMQPIDLVEMIYQTGGEFNELFEQKGLTIITRLPQESVMILADGNRLWRVIQNLYNNVAKYALKDTRVYVEVREEGEDAVFSVKDISAQQLHKTAEDLSERFVQGDVSRKTEGNGLGLAIAKNLTTLMGGEFQIILDGDMFTAEMIFPKVDSF